MSAQRMLKYSLAALLVTLVILALTHNGHQVTHWSSVVVSPPAPQVPAGAYVQIGPVTIEVEIATSSAAVQKGLSGRISLKPSGGMLFMFSKPDLYRFWMPDMHFPIDIIWINDGAIVDISHNASNDFDPARPVYYTPSTPAQYVLEVNAGFSVQKNINIGDFVSFKNI